MLGDDEGLGEMTPLRGVREPSDVWVLVGMVAFATFLGALGGFVWGRASSPAVDGHAVESASVDAGKR